MVESANKSKSHTVNGQYLLEKARVAQTRIREVAREYLRRGWKPIPISARKKYPNNSGWQLNEVTLDNIDSQFMLGHTNIGVQFGPVSNGLCDVDLDCAEARELARFFLPETGAVFGRRSSPAAHWLYQSDIWQQVNTAATTFEDPIVAADDDEHGVMLVELRTGRVGKNKVVKGALSLFPPSRHPSGERVQWDKDGEPARVDGAELSRCVKSLAAAALLVRHYPSKGKQHKAIGLVLGGWLARAGWDESRIAHFVEAVARTAGDAEWQDRVTAAKGAASKLANGEQEIPGTPRMRAVFG